MERPEISHRNQDEAMKRAEERNLDSDKCQKVEFPERVNTHLLAEIKPLVEATCLVSGEGVADELAAVFNPAALEVEEAVAGEMSLGVTVEIDLT